MNSDILISNVDKIHTTELGIDRIKRNLNITGDVIAYCVQIITDKSSTIYKKEKNWYIENNNIIITVNSYSYTIITAHKNKKS